MKCDDAKLKMMDYLYEELNPSEMKELLDHAKHCEECDSEIRELGGTGRLTRSIPQQHPGKPVQVHRTATGKHSVFKTQRKPVRYALVVVFLLFITASLVNLQVEYDEYGFRMYMGLLQSQPAVQTGITAEQMESILAEREAAMLDMFQQDKQAQQDQFALVLNEFMSAVDDQRIRDLDLIANELYRLEDMAGYQLTQTDLLLYNLLDGRP